MSVEVNVREEEEQMRDELANEAPWVGKLLWLVKNSRIENSKSGTRELCKESNTIIYIISNKKQLLTVHMEQSSAWKMMIILAVRQ